MRLTFATPGLRDRPNATRRSSSARPVLIALGHWIIIASCLSATFSAQQALCAQTSVHPAKITVEWANVIRVSKTTPTLQVVVNPLLRRNGAIHDRAFQALRDLKADYVRYVPWMPYPRLGVAELQAPEGEKTSWDFSLVDPLTLDFLNATQGHSFVLNFSTIPQWLFKSDYVTKLPENPDEVVWDYEHGSTLKDPTGEQLGEYYARLASWYVNGGFLDEFGKKHDSGYSYKIPYWEVLNEPDYEHNLSAAQYTTIYDAVSSAVHEVSPQTKFVGVSLATPAKNPDFFEYFLNARNHKPASPIDFISYHFYASPQPDESPDVQQHTFFAQADGFLDVVRYIEAIRKRLSPATRTMINEVGTISAEGANQGAPGQKSHPIPSSYWNLSGAVFAYLFGELSKQGIEVVGESQLVGFPGQFPSVSMLDWNTGQPNARYWVLKLLLEHFHPGDRIVGANSDTPYVYVFSVVTSEGQRRCLLVNKRDRPIEVSIAGAAGARAEYVDQSSADQAPSLIKMEGENITLGGFSVAVITLP